MFFKKSVKMIKPAISSYNLYNFNIYIFNNIFYKNKLQ